MSEGMVLPTRNFTYCITTGCNMRCRYCYEHFGSWRPMPAQERVGFRLLELARDGGGIHFFGGEPLLAWNLIQAMVERAAEEELKISFGVTTNGLLLGEKEAEFIAKHRMGVLLSVDGIREAHDANRVDPQGAGTWDRVLAAAQRLRQAGVKNVILRGTYTTETVQYLYESHLYFLEKFPEYECVMYPAYEGDWNEEVLRVYRDQLSELAALYIRRAQQGRPFRCRLIQDALQWISGRPPSPDWRPCGLGDRSLAVMPDGTLRPCHRLCTVEPFPEEWIFGDVFSGLDQEKFQKSLDWDVRKRRSQADYDCSLCPVEKFCHGYCIAANWQGTGERYTVLKSICDTKLVEYEVGALVWGVVRHLRRPQAQGQRPGQSGRPQGPGPRAQGEQGVPGP